MPNERIEYVGVALIRSPFASLITGIRTLPFEGKITFNQLATLCKVARRKVAIAATRPTNSQIILELSSAPKAAHHRQEPFLSPEELTNQPPPVHLRPRSWHEKVSYQQQR